MVLSGRWDPEKASTRSMTAEKIIAGNQGDRESKWSIKVEFEDLPAGVNVKYAKIVDNGTTVTDPGYTELAVKVTAVMSEDGTIVFTFTNTDTTGAPFSVMMTMKPGVRDNADAPDVSITYQSEVEDTSVITDGVVTQTSYEETITTTVTTTKTTRIKWTVADIKKVSA